MGNIAVYIGGVGCTVERGRRVTLMMLLCALVVQCPCATSETHGVGQPDTEFRSHSASSKLPKSSTRKACDTSPCSSVLTISDLPTRSYKAVEQGKLVQRHSANELQSAGTVSGAPSEERRISDTSVGFNDEKLQGKKPPMKKMLPAPEGVKVMSVPDSSEAARGSEEQQSTSTVSDIPEDPGDAAERGDHSSDDGNGSEYTRKSLKELLVCYHDRDCGPGYECEPFSCAKACSVYTRRQQVSRELRYRYIPDPPSFVYQKMYQTILFRGVGGICYRKCHHMTRCLRHASDGTCADWFCKKVEGCHNYPSDYHVPSLEECGVNGLCKPGKCHKSSDLTIAGDSIPKPPLKDDVTDPNACPARMIPSSSGCCPSGAVAMDGACCPSGSSVDKDGACCPSDRLDACGVCGGNSLMVDILGECCPSELDANGVCCRWPKQVDECGVCGGWNVSCALVPSYSAAASTMSELDEVLDHKLPREILHGAENLGFDLHGMEVEKLVLASVGEETGMVEASVTYKIMPNMLSRNMSGASYMRETASISVAKLTSVQRTGVCGNGMCELEEQTRDGLEGSCPEDCFWSTFIPCECSGHGVCTATTGSCKCHRGYTGPMCAFCDDGYVSVGNDADEGRALCLPSHVIGSLSTKATFGVEIMQSISDPPETIGLEGPLQARSIHVKESGGTPRSVFILCICVAILALVAIVCCLGAQCYRRRGCTLDAAAPLSRTFKEVRRLCPSAIPRRRPARACLHDMQRRCENPQVVEWNPPGTISGSEASVSTTTTAAPSSNSFNVYTNPLGSSSPPPDIPNKKAETAGGDGEATSTISPDLASLRTPPALM